MHRAVNILVSAAALTTAAFSAPQAPVFAKAATGIAVGRACSLATPNQIIASPGRILAVEIRCRPDNPADPNDGVYPHIRLKSPDGRWQIMKPQDGIDEVLWAPDSRAVVINGNENGYTNYTVVYRLEGTRWREIDLTRRAQRDMVKQFPPCKASYRDPVECHDFERDPEFNMAVIAWTRNGKAVIVMAEVPCTSTYGGIMCTVAGFEIALADGTILDRMTAKTLKARWQHAMAWNLRIPDPPSYGPPNPYLEKPKK